MILGLLIELLLRLYVRLFGGKGAMDAMDEILNGEDGW